LFRWQKGVVEQAEGVQRLQPLALQHIRLAPRQGLGVLGVHPIDRRP